MEERRWERGGRGERTVREEEMTSDESHGFKSGERRQWERARSTGLFNLVFCQARTHCSLLRTLPVATILLSFVLAFGDNNMKFTRTN